MAFGTYGPEARVLGQSSVRVKRGKGAISQMLGLNGDRSPLGIPGTRSVLANTLLGKGGECASTLRACLSSRAAFCDRTWRRFTVRCVAERAPVRIMSELLAE